MGKETKEKIEYPVKRIRMDERTWQLLSEGKKKFGKSWNLFLLEIIKKNGTNK